MKYIKTVFLATILFGLIGCPSSNNSSQNKNPTASFTMSTNSGTAPLKVSFDASNSNDSDGTITKYVWDYGNGSNEGKGIKTDHTYTTPSTYDITLTVTDNKNASGEATQKVIVTSNNSNSPPEITKFEAKPASGNVPLKTSFSWQISDKDGDVLDCKLDVNDDGKIDYTINNCTASNTQNHTYTTKGSYITKLIVEDNKANKVEQQISVFANEVANVGEGIAYISPSHLNQEIHFVSPDGSSYKTLWSVPQSIDKHDGIGTLSWHPSATKLAFDSAHDRRSLSIRDVYSLDLNTNHVQRVTNSPDPSAFSDLPKGKVTLQVTSPVSRGSDLVVYVEGSSTAERFIAKPSTTYTITFDDVADFGNNTNQYIHVRNLYSNTLCYYDISDFVDILPNQVVDAGVIRMPVHEPRCSAYFSPSWFNSNLLMISTRIKLFGTKNTIEEVSTDPLLRNSPMLKENINQLFDQVDDFFFLSVAPSAEEMLLIIGDFVSHGIYHTPIKNAESLYERIVPDFEVIKEDYPLSSSQYMAIGGVAWLPNSAGFLFSYKHTIYAYDFTSKKTSKVHNLSDGLVGRISVSPDGQTIAFERGKRADERSNDHLPLGPSLLCPCEIWLVDRDGTNLRKLVDDGRSPTWRPSTAQN